VAPFDRPYTTFYWSAIVSMAVSCIISEIKQGIVSKITNFSYPLNLAPRLGGLGQSITIPFGAEKLV